MGVSAEINAITRTIVGCAIAVHAALGPGLLESAYHFCMIEELRYAGLQVETRVKVPVVYRGKRLDCGYQLDLLVNGLVVLELKAVSAILPIHEAQLLTYMKLTGKPIGLLLNFNVPLMKSGIVRKINT